MEISEIFLSAAITIASIILISITLHSYKTFKNPKLLFVLLVFIFFAIKGFILLAIRKWQMEEKKLVADLMSIDPEERIIEVVKIIRNCRGFLLNAMIKREQQTELDESINQVIEFYKEKYAFR